jgi:hypothetical protein
VPFQDEEATFSPEEVASMMIKTFRSYIESNFAANATEITKGCVVAVRSSLPRSQLNALAARASSQPPP